MISLKAAGQSNRQIGEKVMKGITLIIIGGIITAVGILVGGYSIVFEMTNAKKIREQLKNEYQDTCSL